MNSHEEASPDEARSAALFVAISRNWPVLVPFLFVCVLAYAQPEAAFPAAFGFVFGAFCLGPSWVWDIHRNSVRLSKIRERFTNVVPVDVASLVDADLEGEMQSLSIDLVPGAAESELVALLPRIATQFKVHEIDMVFDRVEATRRHLILVNHSKPESPGAEGQVIV